MLDLTEKSLPETVTVDGSDYFVQTDFRYWLKFAKKVSEKKTIADFMFLFPYDKPVATMSAYTALFEFYNPKNELPRDTGNDTGERALDYEIDADLIVAAFWQQYGIDLTEVKLHWWKFQALMRGLKDTKLNEIISYRLYQNTTGKHDSYTKEMERLKKAWALPEEIDEEANEALKKFDALFE